MSELVDAHDAGLIDGDPLQIYLIPSIPQGDFGLGGEWQQFVENLKLLWELTDVASRIGGAAGAALLIKEVLTRRSKGAAEITERHSSDWMNRGAAPADLINLLAAKPRDTREISSLLGISHQEAEAILWSLGFSPDDSSRWIRGADKSAQLIADDLELSFTDVLMTSDAEDQYRAIIEERLQKFREKGEPPFFKEDREELRSRYFSSTNDDAVPVPFMQRIRRWVVRLRRR